MRIIAAGEHRLEFATILSFVLCLRPCRQLEFSRPAFKDPLSAHLLTQLNPTILGVGVFAAGQPFVAFNRRGSFG